MEYPEYDEYPDYEDEMRPIGFRDDDAYMGDTSYVGDKTHGLIALWAMRPARTPDV